MNYTFNLGKVHVPTPIGMVEVEDIRVDVQNVELKEVLMLMKELPAFTKAMKEATEEAPSPSAGNPMMDIIGEALKSKMGQSQSPFGAGFPFGNSMEGVDVEDVEHPLFGKGKAVKIDPSKFMSADIAGDISKFLNGLGKQSE